MTDNGNISNFDPADHLVKLKFKGKNGNEVQQDFLKGTSALNWFYSEHPLGEGRIITDLVQIEPPIFRAEVWINDVKVATAHANPDGNSTTLKKIETVAIRRALANAGYGTDQVIARIAKSIGVDAAKKMLGSNKEASERRMGSPAPQQPPPKHKKADLTAWALINIYENNEHHMNASINKLIEAGKLGPHLTLEEAKNVVRDRHAEDKVLEPTG